MPDPPSQDPQRVVVACSHCQKSLAAPRASLGKKAACPACGEAFVLEEKRPAKPPPLPQAASTSGGNCGVCQCEIEAGEAAASCPACSSGYHQECWDYNQGCAMYGCSESPETEGLTTLEIPASHWGQENKACPRCNQTILAAAVRCKFCGATFASSAPQQRDDFHASQQTKSKLPMVRTVSVWLLLFSLLPCTAPIAAVVGSVWYYVNRDAIRALPAMNSALCKIAVGVAVIETAMLGGFALMYAILGG